MSVLGPGGKPGHVTTKDRREETLVGGGRGILSTGLLAGRFRQGQKPSHWSSPWNPASRTEKSPELPLRQKLAVRSPVYCVAGTVSGYLETETSSAALTGGNTQKLPKTALLAN